MAHISVKIAQNVQKLQLNFIKSVIIKKNDTNPSTIFFVYLAYELNHRLFFCDIISAHRLAECTMRPIS